MNLNVRAHNTALLDSQCLVSQPQPADSKMNFAVQVISAYAYNKRCAAPLRIAIATAEDGKTIGRLRKISGETSCCTKLHV